MGAKALGLLCFSAGPVPERWNVKSVFIETPHGPAINWTSLFGHFCLATEMNSITEYLRAHSLASAMWAVLRPIDQLSPLNNLPTSLTYRGLRNIEVDNQSAKSSDEQQCLPTWINQKHERENYDTADKCNPGVPSNTKRGIAADTI